MFPRPLAELAKQAISDLRTTQIFVVSAIALFLASQWVIARRKGRRLPPNVTTDTVYWLLNPSVRLVSRVCISTFMIAVALTIGRRLTSPELFEGFGPVMRQPRWLIVLELFLFGDLASYWIHRWCHTVPWLWRLHVVHHSSTDIMWTSTARQHPLNEVLNGFNILPLFLIGFPVNLLLPYGPAVGMYAIFQHTKLNISMGPLRAIVNSPNFHRWHHTLSHEGGNKNFANVFSLWDRLFGTFYMPEDRLPEKFGLDAEVVPESFMQQLMYPFRKRPAASLAPDVASAPAERPGLRV